MIRPNRPHRPSVRALLAVPVALAVSLLAACTGGGDDVPSSAPSSSSAATVAINSQPRSVIADGGELRLPVSDFGDQWNPLHADASDDAKLITGTLLPRLFNEDGSGNPSPNPDYLAAVNATGDNPQVVTYTLNPSAVWGNGRAIDASDFIADWQACNGQNVSFKCADTKKYAAVASVKQGTTPQQVIVTYQGAYDAWPQTFDTLLPKEGVADPDTFNDGWTSLDKISDWTAGPFEVDKLDTDKGVLLEKPNPDWWDDPAKLGRLTFRKVAPEDRVKAMQDNQIDAVDLSSDPDQAAGFAKIAGCEIREATEPGGETQIVATRTSLANYGAFGKSSVIWTDVGFLPPAS